MTGKKALTHLFFIATGLLFSSAALAVCPLCVVAVGAGLGFSRWLGVDDVVSSIWIGALLASLSMWTVIWMNKKNWGFKYDKIIVLVLYYVLVLLPLYYADIAGHPLNKIFGIDKIVFGALLGSFVFLGSLWLHDFLKTKNQGKSFFQYQKVAVPVLVLLITSLIFYYLLK